MKPFTGCMEVICGPMFSGKTEELIRRLRRAQIARQRVIVFKPSIDVRFSENDVVSHSQQRLISLPVTSVAEVSGLLERTNYDVDVVGIDEVQFFTSEIISLAENLANRGIRVILAGLDQDYLGQPFGAIPELLARADLITKQAAVCVVCGASATRSQRIQGKVFTKDSSLVGNPVEVGAAEGYEARCRGCHVPHIDSSKAAAKEPLVNERLFS